MGVAGGRAAASGVLTGAGEATTRAKGVWVACSTVCRMVGSVTVRAVLVRTGKEVGAMAWVSCSGSTHAANRTDTRTTESDNSNPLARIANLQPPCVFTSSSPCDGDMRNIADDRAVGLGN